MTIDPVTVPVTTQTVATLTCNLLYMDRLGVDASNRNGVVPAGIRVAPYALDAQSNPQYAAPVQEYTADLYMAAVVIPSIGPAMTAVQQAIVDWENYAIGARANLATAQTAQAAAQSTYDSAVSAWQTASDAFQAGTGPQQAEADTGSAVSVAGKALQAASANVVRLKSLLDPAVLGSAQAAVQTAQAAVTTAGANVTADQTAALTTAQAQLTALTTPPAPA